MAHSKIRWLLATAAEPKEAADWYFVRNPQAGRRFVKEINRRIAQIAKRPESWPINSDQVRQAPLKGFPFAIVYQTTSGWATIVAIAHASRRYGYWRRRIQKP